ncbi:unnamed protein product [Ranitomeya imitator]|uniref:Ig-like domain-containing protein n=1 Tax=Ranitomeya imitator TaxID=111125 RepID=A0ABN9M545_9NEOB|nr:unnamed protein product [Ranitomeya imitator]
MEELDSKSEKKTEIESRYTARKEEDSKSKRDVLPIPRTRAEVVSGTCEKVDNLWCLILNVRLLAGFINLVAPGLITALVPEEGFLEQEEEACSHKINFPIIAHKMIFLITLVTSVIILFSSGVTTEDITGWVNDTVTLPCTYRARKAAVGVSWRRASCANTTCTSTILRTNGSSVTKRTSKRYELLGNVKWGDASLTITKLTTKHKGAYCCKVSIPGPSNDVKREVNLRIMKLMAKSVGTLEIVPENEVFLQHNQEVYNSWHCSYKPGCGWQRKIDERLQHKIVRMVDKQPQSSSKEIQAVLQAQGALVLA